MYLIIDLFYILVNIDHTTGLYNGYYLMFKPTTSDTPGDTAQFQSRNFASASSNACIFIFYYYMFGVRIFFIIF